MKLQEIPYDKLKFYQNLLNLRLVSIRVIPKDSFIVLDQHHPEGKFYSIHTYEHCSELLVFAV